MTVCLQSCTKIIFAALFVNSLLGCSYLSRIGKGLSVQGEEPAQLDGGAEEEGRDGMRLRGRAPE